MQLVGELHTCFQGWEFAHSLIAHLLISLKSNERLWAIRSGRSEEMSDVSESLIFGQKTSDSLRNQMNEFPALPASC